MITHEGKVLLWYVRIRQGPQQALAESVYYRKDMTFEFMTRWKWYFLYREARYRVEAPKAFTELSIGNYEADPRTTNEIKAKRLRDRITNKKGKITEISNRMKKAREKWNSLFPIEEDPWWSPALAKIEELQCELATMELEYHSLMNIETVENP
jgi:hypothetical protein